MKNIRRTVAIVVITSFSIAALMGIAVLLRGGDIGETEGRVLLTTVAVGIESVAMLCYLATAGSRAWPVGLAGALASLGAFGWSLALIWGNEPAEDGWKWYAALLILAGSFAQASLLLGFAGRFRALVGITVVLIAAVAAGTINDVFNYVQEDWYYRTLGIVGILDALGTVVAIALGAAQGLRREKPVTEPPAAAFALSPETAALLAQVARERQLTPDQLVAPLLGRAASGDDAGDRQA